MGFDTEFIGATPSLKPGVETQIQGDLLGGGMWVCFDKKKVVFS